MKKYHLSIALLFLSLSLWSQRNEMTKLLPFKEIHIGSGFRAEFVISDTYGVYSSEKSLIGEQIRVDGNKLVIQEKKNISREQSKKNAESKIIIYAPSLEVVDLSGASQLRSDDIIHAKEFDVEISGASSVHLNVQTDELSIDQSGASNSEFSGSCKALKLDLSGASSCKAFDMKSQTTHLDISGASKTQLSTEEVGGSVGGASSVTLKQSVIKNNTLKTGGSSVVRFQK